MKAPQPPGAAAPPLPTYGLKFGLRHALKIIVGLGILWLVFPRFGDLDPLWAGVSLVVVVSEVSATRTASAARILHTVIGCVAGLACLWLLGDGLASMCVAVAAVVVFCSVVIGSPSSWKIAPATTVIVMAQVLHGTVGPSALQVGLRRMIEVTVGSLLAVALSEVFEWIAPFRLVPSKGSAVSPSHSGSA